MLFRSWDRFSEACENLARSDRARLRTCLRWRHEAGLLVIRVTDDHQTLTFKARSAVFLNRFDTLNKTLLSLHQNRRAQVARCPTATSREGEDVRIPPSEGYQHIASPDPTADAGAKSKKKKGKKKTGK